MPPVPALHRVLLRRIPGAAHGLLRDVLAAGGRPDERSRRFFRVRGTLFVDYGPSLLGWFGALRLLFVLYLVRHGRGWKLHRHEGRFLGNRRCDGARSNHRLFGEHSCRDPATGRELPQFTHARPDDHLESADAYFILFPLRPLVSGAEKNEQVMHVAAQNSTLTRTSSTM
jgi:hypothetical protein